MRYFTYQEWKQYAFSIFGEISRIILEIWWNLIIIIFLTALCNKH